MLKGLGPRCASLLLIGCVLSPAADAATAAESAPHLDGALLGLAWATPFAGILLSIGFCQRSRQ